jgi:hypothetical protein
MSIPNATKLIEDRIEFKFYATNYYLKALKDMESKGITPHDFSARVEWEILAENLLFHLVGALDALLRRINEKLDLKIGNPRQLNVENVYKKLGSRKDLLKEAYELLCDKDGKSLKSGWLYELTELRNIVTHRAIPKLNFSATDKEVSFDIKIIRESIAAIPYLEKSIQQMQNLITKIRSKDASLSSPDV